MRAVSLANAERRPVAPSGLADLWDPARAPAAALPHLAGMHGVSVWRADWSEGRKRQVISQTLDLKSRRGTIPCFEGHLGFLDATLLQVIAPPSRAIALQSQTPAERQAWLAQFPQLRVYRFQKRARLGGVMTPGPWRSAALTVQDSQASRYVGQRAVVIDQGVESAAVVLAAKGQDPFSQTLTISLPSYGRRCVLGPASARFLVPMTSRAGDQIFMFRAALGGPDTVRPGLRAIDIAPERGADPLIGLAAVCAGQALVGPFRFLRTSRAREAVYDAIRLFEPSRVKAGKVQRRAGLTAGFSRLGQPAFHLELSVDLSVRRAKARRLPNLPGFVQAYDPTRVEEAMAAIRAAKLGRDKVQIRTALHRRITAGDAVPLNGTVRLGQIIRSL